MNKILLVLLFLISSTSASETFANKYTVDNKTSQVDFQVDHFKFDKVKGKFQNFEGSISLDLNNLNTFQSNGSIQAASINTAIKARDEHLRSAEIFNTVKFPEILFSANTIKEITKNKNYEATGKLTIKGISKPIKINMTIVETTPEYIIFKAKTIIKRNDFNIKWSNLVEGANLVSDKVAVDLLIKAQSLSSI